MSAGETAGPANWMYRNTLELQIRARIHRFQPLGRKEKKKKLDSDPTPHKNLIYILPFQNYKKYNFTFFLWNIIYIFRSLKKL